MNLGENLRKTISWKSCSGRRTEEKDVATQETTTYLLPGSDSQCAVAVLDGGIILAHYYRVATEPFFLFAPSQSNWALQERGEGGGCEVVIVAMAPLEGLCRRLGVHHPTLAVVLLQFGSCLVNTVFSVASALLCFLLSQLSSLCLPVLLRQGLPQPLQDQRGLVPSRPGPFHGLERRQRSPVRTLPGMG